MEEERKNEQVHESRDRSIFSESSSESDIAGNESKEEGKYSKNIR